MKQVTMFQGKLRYALKAVLALILFTAAPAAGQVRISVTLDDTTGVTNPTTDNLRDAIADNAEAAINEWLKYLSIPGPRGIEVIVRFNPTSGRGSGRSVTSSFVRTEGRMNIFEQGVTAELRTGIDPNGRDYDVEFNFDPGYLRDQIWFDPNPAVRTDRVPADRIDSMSFFLHEFAHALAFNGWKDPGTGQLPGNDESTYDYYADFDGANWFFHGPNAMRLWGAALPLSRVNNNYHHYGNLVGSGAPGTESSLTNGLMNGVYFNYGKRYKISLLDIAILKDAGVDVLTAFNFTEPTQLTLAFSPAGRPRITWNAIPLAVFVVQYRDSMTSSWRMLTTTNAIAGSASLLSVDDTSTPLPAQRYYRVGFTF